MAAQMQQDGSRRGNAVRWAVWGFAAALLLLPLVAMQFTRDVQWTGMDFAVFGTMLFVACGIFEVATRLSISAAYRAAAGIAVLCGFLQVWINLAVGVIGSEHNGANLLFGGVLLVAIVGAVVARFRPRGLVRAMVVAALAQASVPAVALLMGETDLRPALALTVVFGGMWLVSAWLFSKAGTR